MRACVHQPAAGGHVEAARCGKSTPEATRRGSKRAAAAREGGCVHTRPRPGPLFTTRPRLAVRTELPLCALAPRSPTHQWDLTRSNFGPVRVGPVASELGRAAVPQGGFQADGQARGGPAESREARRGVRFSRQGAGDQQAVVTSGDVTFTMCFFSISFRLSENELKHIL